VDSGTEESPFARQQRSNFYGNQAWLELSTLPIATEPAASTALVIFVDELHYVPEPQLAALIAAMHRCVQRQLPVLLVGTSLPKLRGRMVDAKSYAERLFTFHEIGPLEAGLRFCSPAG
jgi:hypothetical protein